MCVGAKQRLGFRVEGYGSRLKLLLPANYITLHQMDKLQYEKMEYEKMGHDEFFCHPGEKPVQVIFVLFYVTIFFALLGNSLSRLLCSNELICVCACVRVCVRHSHSLSLSLSHTHKIAPAKSVPFLGEIMTTRTKCLVPRAFFKRTTKDKDRMQDKQTALVLAHEYHGESWLL